MTTAIFGLLAGVDKVQHSRKGEWIRSASFSQSVVREIQCHLRASRTDSPLVDTAKRSDAPPFVQSEHSAITSLNSNEVNPHNHIPVKGDCPADFVENFF
jgi:hypothetical protein